VVTYVMASLRAPRESGIAPRVDCIAFPERGQLRITITADPLLTCELLRMLQAMLDASRG
jgi:hypothetical protein